jgi:RNA polymerase sigma-70 factor (ECF subfamily)
MILNEDNSAQRFNAAIAAHLDAGYNLARWLTRSADDAEDVLQEACLRAFRFFATFRGGDARAWFLTIVRNASYTWLQQNRRGATEVEYDDDIDSLQGVMDEGEEAMHRIDPQRLLLREVDRQLIENALLMLRSEYREILVLRELEDLSYKEIADIAGIPLGTVMSRLSRARTQLRRCIETLEPL